MMEAALSFVDASDRDTWVTMAMAIKSELGESGFEIWDAWSQQDGSYKPRDAKAVWRSVKPHGGITIKSLYAEARKNGYQGDEVKATPRPRDFRKERQDRLREQRRREQAANKALAMMQSAELQIHPYLASKGHPSVTGFVFDGLLLVPMRDHRDGKINSLQTIDAEGNKKFLPGGRAKGSVFPLGGGVETYLCEGFATALSVREALTSLYRRSRVVVCFSAYNMAHVASHFGGYVIADHDESGTGEKYAAKTGLPWWMPPDPGDANDFHQAHGIAALAHELNDMRRQFNSHKDSSQFG